MKTYVIADIHSAYLALKQVIEKSPIKPKDRLIFTADYFDGWSQAWDTLCYLLKLQESYECIFLMGNHDEWLMDFLTDGQKCDSYDDWLINGGQSTLDSFNQMISDDPTMQDDLKDFVFDLNPYFIDEDNRLFVHAGFTEDEGVEFNDAYDLYWDRWLAKETFKTNRKPTCLDTYHEVFIGHTTTQSIYGVDKPLNRYNLWNLDTGAGWNGKLTMMDVESKEYWQSDLVTSLYPNEMGRNK